MGSGRDGARSAEREQELVDAIGEFDEAGVYASQNQLAKVLPSNISFLDDKMREGRRQELKRLGWGDPSKLRRERGEAMRMSKRAAGFRATTADAHTGASPSP